MKVTLKVFLILIVIISFFACTQNVPARDSVEWVGHYTGITPAASTPGLNITISLGADETFLVKYYHLDTNPEDLITIKTGKFTWNETGDIINLSIISGELPSYYKVGQNTLTQLDMNGHEITGEFADMYVLSKVDE